MKARVAEITGAELLTEAVWLRRLIAREIQQQAGEAVAEVSRHQPRVARGEGPAARGRAHRLYVRLRREDGLMLHERAAARGMASATYVSVLVRAHLRSLTPLPKDELAALKHAVGELGAVGRNLNQIARAMNQGARGSTMGRDEFRAILKLCEALRDHTKGLIRTNTASWATGYAEDAS
jgi:hypothetical protein